MKRVCLATLVAILSVAPAVLTGGEAPDKPKEDKAADKGLVGWWSFDKLEETESGVVVKDSSPNRLDGLISGEAKQVEGKVGKALDLSGEKVFVQVKFAEALDFDSAVSLVAWVKPASEQPYKGMAGIAERHGQVYRLCLKEKETPYSLVFQTLAEGYKFAGATSGRDIKADEWVFVAATHDCESGKFALYLNGKLAAESKREPPAPFIKNKAGFVMGTRDTLAFLRGALDEVRLYSRALTADEIGALYKKESGAADKPKQ